MAAHPGNDASRRNPEILSLGPDCAAFTSIGTVYLYRLGAADILAYCGFPSAYAPAEKFRALLGRIASTCVSDKGVAQAGPLRQEQLRSLNDDEVERLAEAYLESSNLRWYQQDAASMPSGPRRKPGEPASAFLERLVTGYAAPHSGPAPVDAAAAAISAVAAAGKSPSTQKRERPARAPWLAIGSLLLLVVGAAAVAALAQGYFTTRALRQEQANLSAQLRELREANASLGSQLARLNEQNTELRRRVGALDGALRAQPAPPPKAHEPKPKSSIARAHTPKARPVAEGRARGATRSWPR